MFTLYGSGSIHTNEVELLSLAALRSFHRNDCGSAPNTVSRFHATTTRGTLTVNSEVDEVGVFTRKLQLVQQPIRTRRTETTGAAVRVQSLC